MSLRDVAAARLPASFEWLQRKGLYPKAVDSKDARRLGDCPSNARYGEELVGRSRAANLSERMITGDDEPSARYLALLRNIANYSEKPWDFGYFDVPDVKIWNSFGVHSSPAGNFVQVYCSPRALDNPKYELTRRALALRPARQRLGSAIFLGPAWYHNHYHWMIDILPRLQLVREHLDQGLAVVVPPDLRASARDALGLALRSLGADCDRVLDLAPGVYEFDRLIMPTNLSHPLDVTARQRDFLRSACLPAGTSPTRRIYVTRRDASVRRIVNEDQVVPLLERRGFEVVTLSGLSLTGQAELFAGASAVVSHHGAGLTNLAFCAPGATAIEVYQDGHFAPPFARLAQLGELTYGFLVGAAEGEDTRVDPAQLCSVLDQAGL